MKTQQSITNRIAALLERGHTITSMQAISKFGCTRLAARIKDLRNVGWEIDTIKLRTPEGKTVAKYKLTNA